MHLGVLTGTQTCAHGPPLWWRWHQQAYLKRLSCFNFSWSDFSAGLMISRKMWMAPFLPCLLPLTMHEFSMQTAWQRRARHSLSLSLLGISRAEAGAQLHVWPDSSTWSPDHGGSTVSAFRTSHHLTSHLAFPRHPPRRAPVCVGHVVVSVNNSNSTAFHDYIFHQFQILTFFLILGNVNTLTL